jgi:hypothetical protein
MVIERSIKARNGKSNGSGIIREGVPPAESIPEGRISEVHPGADLSKCKRKDDS